MTRPGAESVAAACAAFEASLGAWLAARAEARDGDGGADRAPLLDHLRRCGACRGRAVAADPAALFAIALPAPADAARIAGAAAASGMDPEAEAMVVAVRNLRRAQALAPRGAVAVRRLAEVPRRARLAAALTAVALGLGGAWYWGSSGDARFALGGAVEGPVPSAIPVAARLGAGGETGGEMGLLPLVEDVGLPDARVYEFGGPAARRGTPGVREASEPGLSVVLIVDKTLDV